MRLKGLLKNSIILGVAFAFIFCFVPLITLAANPEVIKVGILIPLSGTSAEIGPLLKNAMDIAFEEINQGGGIKSLGGAKLQMIIGDTSTKPEVGASEAERLITKEKVPVIIGSFNSPVIMTSSTVAERYKVPFISLCGTLTDITNRGYKYLFRPTPHQDQITVGMVKFLKDMSARGPRIKRVAITADFGFKKNTMLARDRIQKETDFEIVVEEYFPSGQIDMTPSILKLKAAKPDVIVAGMAGPGDAILFFRTLYETKLDCLGILGCGSSFLYEPTLKGSGKLCNYSLSSDPWAPRMPVPPLQKYLKTYKERHKFDSDVSAAEAYICVWILKEALEKAASVNREDIKNALVNLDINIPGRNHPALIASPYRIKFGPDGQNTYVMTAIEQVFDQKTTTVYPPEIAERPVVWPVPPWDKR